MDSGVWMPVPERADRSTHDVLYKLRAHSEGVACQTYVDSCSGKFKAVSSFAPSPAEGIVRIYGFSKWSGAKRAWFPSI